MASGDDIASSDPFGWRSSLSAGADEFAALSAAALSGASGLGGASYSEQPGAHERYRTISVLGQGGMGRVWFGWDEVLSRHVAIKEPLGGSDSPEAARLMREAMLTARLEHPGAVAIHDVYHIDGRPHFVMALVRGETLSERLARLRVEGGERTRLLRHVLEACEIIAHAHRRGVLHRDITPRNVLIDADGSARVIDWGLAVATDEDAHAASSAGTPGFMSPEQRAGGPVDARSDVWSLGALLHFILHAEPPSSAAARPQALDPELDAIVACALAQDPDRRYADAREMGEDLRRWFDGRLVRAYDATPTRLIARFVRHYRLPIALASLALLALGASLAWGILSTSREARRAKAAAGRAEQESRRAQEATQLARREAAKTRETLSELYVREFGQAIDSGDIHRAHESVARALELHDGPLQRGAQMRAALLARPTLVASHDLPACSERWYAAPRADTALCVDEQRKLVGFVDGELAWQSGDHASALIHVSATHVHHIDGGQRGLTYDLRTGELVFTDTRLGRFANRLGPSRVDMPREVLLDAPELETPCVMITDARRDAAGDWWQLCDGGTLWRQRGASFEPVPLPPADVPTHFAFDDRGRAWLINDRGTLFPHDRSLPPLDFKAAADYIEPIAGTPLLLVQGRQRTARVLDTQRGAWLASFGEGVSSARALPNGEIALVRDGGPRGARRLERWRLPDARFVWKRQYNSGFTAASWSADSRHLFVLSGDGALHAISPRDGLATVTSAGTLVGKDVAVHPMGGDVFTANMDRKGLRRFALEGGELELLERLPEPLVARRLDVLSDGTVAGLGWGTYMSFGDPAAGQADDVVMPEPMRDMDARDDARELVLCGYSKVWRVGVEDKAFTPAGWDHPVTSCAVAQDGALALGSRTELVVLNPDGSLRAKIPIDSHVLDLDWRPGHDQVVTGHYDGHVVVWDAESLTELARARPHVGRAAAVAASPDGSLVASASWDASVSFLDLTVLDQASLTPPRAP
jgi:WD40 repeat protein